MHPSHAGERSLHTPPNLLYLNMNINVRITRNLCYAKFSHRLAKVAQTAQKSAQPATLR